MSDGGMVGRTYLLPDGRLGKVVARWSGNGCPRNVLVAFEDGSMTCRPFRGLRRLKDSRGVVANGPVA